MTECNHQWVEVQFDLAVIKYGKDEMYPGKYGARVTLSHFEDEKSALVVAKKVKEILEEHYKFDLGEWVAQQ